MLYGCKVLGGNSWLGNCMNQPGYKALSICLSQLLTKSIAFLIFFSCSSTIVAGVWYSVNVLHASLGKDTQTGQRSLI